MKEIIKAFRRFWILRLMKIRRNRDETNPISIEEYRKGAKRSSKIIASYQDTPTIKIGEEKHISGVKCTYFTDVSSPKKTVLNLHGGGYINGLEHTGPVHFSFLKKLCSLKSIDAYCPEYRLAPENKFPAAWDDCEAVYDYILGQGVKPEDLIIIGDSAGGGLTLGLLLKLRDDGKPLPSKAILLSPVSDLAATGESLDTRNNVDPFLSGARIRRVWRHIVELIDIKNPYASPLYGDYKGLPPLHFILGSDEVLYDDSIRAHEKCLKAGTPSTLSVYEGMFHVFPLFYDLFDEADQAIEEIAGHLD